MIINIYISIYIYINIYIYICIQVGIPYWYSLLVFPKWSPILSMAPCTWYQGRGTKHSILPTSYVYHTFGIKDTKHLASRAWYQGLREYIRYQGYTFYKRPIGNTNTEYQYIHIYILICIYTYIYSLIVINQYILLVSIYSLLAIPDALSAGPGPGPATDREHINTNRIY